MTLQDAALRWPPPPNNSQISDALSSTGSWEGGGVWPRERVVRVVGQVEKLVTQGDSHASKTPKTATNGHQLMATAIGASELGCQRVCKRARVAKHIP